MTKYKPTRTKREAAQALRKAARLIEQHGHRRCAGGSIYGGFCLLGALSAVRTDGKEGYRWTQVGDDDVAKRALQKTTGFLDVYSWNDNLDTCPDQATAVAKLRETARALEHGLDVGKAPALGAQ